MSATKRAQAAAILGIVPRGRRFPHVAWDAEYEEACAALDFKALPPLEQAVRLIEEAASDYGVSEGGISRFTDRVRGVLEDYARNA